MNSASKKGLLRLICDGSTRSLCGWLWHFTDYIMCRSLRVNSEAFTGIRDAGNSGWLIAVSSVTGKKGRIPLNYVRLKEVLHCR